MNTYTAIASDDTPSLEAIKAQHKATWEDGDYSHFAKYMQEGAIEVLKGWDIAPHTTLLDVGCGAGQTAIPAAESGIQVTGIDLAENLVEYARERARKADLNARFHVGDAEDLPYADQSYDFVVSMFGAMFAPRPERVVNEFARLLKPGGQLFMANWTPTSMPTQMFKAVSRLVPTPSQTIPPVLWGDQTTVKQRLGKDFTDIRLTVRTYPQWQYPFDADELVNLFRTYFGPVKRAFDSSSDADQLTLRQSLKHIFQSNSTVKNGLLTITGGEYLEVVATRR
ncbi:MAG: class I SAM-dependent methyltransferase [Halopseudomonas sp.]